MLTLRLIISALAFIVSASAMRLVTYNLRFDSMPDNITVSESITALSDPLQAPVFLRTSEEQPWSTRRLRIAEHLLAEGIVVAGFQEALVRQVDDLAELFGDQWAWVGVGRDDGASGGEFNPVFYHKPSVTLNSNDTFWLSETPFEVSRFPGAGSNRICTVTHLTLKNGSKNFTYLNTHLDNVSDDQRQVGASLVLTRARFEAVHNGPVILGGDFNSEPTGDGSGAYEITTGAKDPVAINSTFAEKFAVDDDQLPDFKFLDLRGQAPRRNVSANYATFTDFNPPNDTSEWTRIDFVFGASNLGWSTSGYKVDWGLGDDGVLESDHRPTFVDLSFD